jgi:DNA adenine methylase
MENLIIKKENFKISEISYKRSKNYVKSPFRYPGGKFYALPYLMPFIDCVPHDEYREPFVGGGTIFFAKDKVQFNWINDLDTPLFETYQVIKDKTLCEELCLLLDNEIATKERHSEVKSFIPQLQLERAFKNYYLNRTSYSGITHKPAWGYKDKKSSPPQNWSDFLRKANEKLEQVKITNDDFWDVINAPSILGNVLLYLDPPYFLADQKRAYSKSFNMEDHYRLVNALKQTNFFFCLSYDDCAEVRDLYKWANIYERKWLYNTANKKGVARDLGNELIITNYEVDFYNPKLSLF